MLVQERILRHLNQLVLQVLLLKHRVDIIVCAVFIKGKLLTRVFINSGKAILYSCLHVEGSFEKILKHNCV